MASLLPVRSSSPNSSLMENLLMPFQVSLDSLLSTLSNRCSLVLFGSKFEYIRMNIPLVMRGRDREREVIELVAGGLVVRDFNWSRRDTCADAATSGAERKQMMATNHHGGCGRPTVTIVLVLDLYEREIPRRW
ncbi:hypothetical protein L1887_27194 [Cichorium endivia]|nr:hypothetical protein L1887_27194 [Cichorium endivia]